MHSYSYLNQLHTPSKLDPTTVMTLLKIKSNSPEKPLNLWGLHSPLDFIPIPKIFSSWTCQIRQDRHSLFMKSLHTSRNLQRDQTLPSLNHKKRLLNCTLSLSVWPQPEGRDYKSFRRTELLPWWNSEVFTAINISEPLKLFHEWHFEVSRIPPQGVGNEPKANVGNNQKFLFCVYIRGI